MIVCHCNRITSAEIESATVAFLEADGYAIATPGAIFRCCGKRPECGGCMDNFVAHINSARRNRDVERAGDESCQSAG